jgi:hypothetical protein
MGFLAGFTKGIGDEAKQYNQNYMDMQLKKYQSASKIWEAMANDQNYHPAIRQKFAQYAMQLGGVNLFDKNSRAAADEITKQNPHDVATQAHDAQQMTQSAPQPPTQTPDQSGGGFSPQFISQMPQSLYGPEGYKDPMAVNQAEMATKEREAYGQANAQQQAMLHMMHSMGGDATTATFGETGAPPGSSLDRMIKEQWTKDFLFKRPPTRPTSTMPIDGHPATFFNGGHFIDGEPIKASSSVAGKNMRLEFVQDKNTGETYWDYLIPGDPRLGPKGNLTKPILTRSSEKTTSTDPAQLTTTSHTQTSGSYSGSESVPQGMPQAPSPAQTAIPQTAPGAVPAGGVVPDPALVKSSYGATSTGMEQQAWTGLQQSSRITGLIRQYPMVGPILGRVVELGNKIGSSWLLNKAAEFSGVGKPAAADKSYEDAVNSIQQAAKDVGAPDDAAQAAAELITAMRAMNAAETAMLSGGGGRGITRMYEMLKPALMNPTQDANLIHGHMKSVDTLFAGKLRSLYRQRYGDKVPPLSADQMQYAKEAGIYDLLLGKTAPIATTPPISAPVSGGNGTKTYKSYRRNPKTGQRWGSDDGERWFDVTTGSEYYNPNGSYQPVAPTVTPPVNPQ